MNKVIFSNPYLALLLFIAFFVSSIASASPSAVNPDDLESAIFEAHQILETMSEADYQSYIAKFNSSVDTALRDERMPSDLRSRLVEMRRLSAALPIQKNLAIRGLDSMSDGQGGGGSSTGPTPLGDDRYFIVQLLIPLVTAVAMCPGMFLVLQTLATPDSSILTVFARVLLVLAPAVIGFSSAGFLADRETEALGGDNGVTGEGESTMP